MVNSSDFNQRSLPCDEKKFFLKVIELLNLMNFKLKSVSKSSTSCFLLLTESEEKSFR